MRYLALGTAIILGCVSIAAAQPVMSPGTAVPPGANPETGARPGNEIGTGASMPMSDKASNISPDDTKSVIAPNLPSPPIGENATPRDYLMAARSALIAGRSGEAQQALEMAETRALDRSVPLFQTNAPSQDPLIADIKAARLALSSGDRMRAVQIIEAAIPRAGQPTRN